MIAGTLTESEANLRVFLAAGGLILLGILLLIGTVVWWRSTRPDPMALAPLEVMSTKRWSKAADVERRRLADAVRPGGEAAAAEASAAASPIVDLDRHGRSEVAEADDFDDLREVDPSAGTKPDLDVEHVVVHDLGGDDAADGDVAPGDFADGDVAAGDVAAVDESDVASPEPHRGDGDGIVAIAVEPDVVGDLVDADSESEPEAEPERGRRHATSFSMIDPLLRSSRAD